MITREDILHLSKLANICLDEKETERLTESLDKVVSFIDTINDVDDNCQEFEGFDDGLSFCCEDEPGLSLEREDVLKNASCCDEQYFVLEAELFKVN